MKFELAPLPYAPNALEPYIDAMTMEIHHGKHHAAYTANLNAALDKHPELEGKSIEALLSDLAGVPEDIRGAVRNNGGGFYNHNLFWASMSSNGGGNAKGPVAEAVTKTFGSFEAFKEAFSNAAMTRFGSGWTWLCKDRSGGAVVMSTANQDTPLAEGLTPLLGLDVWEHAYYLKYQNRRAEYVGNWWNVVNWDEVSRRF
ncbi:MAG TPA: superoxide dismutase [Anaerolineales bacterium]|nr:superoxide dismutase [Anaerolineales bacterium]